MLGVGGSSARIGRAITALALVAAARRECPEVAASIFVNPKQFNDSQDLARYPRPEERDAEMLRHAGVDVLFMPSVEEMYPPGDVTAITIDGPSRGFEGDHRPGHFNGVAIVCLKLFHRNFLRTRKMLSISNNIVRFHVPRRRARQVLEYSQSSQSQ